MIQSGRNSAKKGFTEMIKMYLSKYNIKLSFLSIHTTYNHLLYMINVFRLNKVLIFAGPSTSLWGHDTTTQTNPLWSRYTDTYTLYQSYIIHMLPQRAASTPRAHTSPERCQPTTTNTTWLSVPTRSDAGPGAAARSAKRNGMEREQERTGTYKAHPPKDYVVCLARWSACVLARSSAPRVDERVQCTTHDTHTHTPKAYVSVCGRTQVVYGHDSSAPSRYTPKHGRHMCVRVSTGMPPIHTRAETTLRTLLQHQTRVMHMRSAGSNRNWRRARALASVSSTTVSQSYRHPCSDRAAARNHHSVVCCLLSVVVSPPLRVCEMLAGWFVCWMLWLYIIRVFCVLCVDFI